MTRIIAAAALVALAFTATAQARVTYGMNGNGTYTGSGTADCNDGTTVSFQCDGIAGINPWNTGDFQSTPGSTGMDCAAAACGGHGGVDLMSVAFEIDQSWLEEESIEADDDKSAKKLVLSHTGTWNDDDLLEE